jgi:hypothetical protein
MAILTYSNAPTSETPRFARRLLAAVASTLGTLVEVVSEASDECAAARDRFPLAD